MSDIVRYETSIGLSHWTAANVSETVADAFDVMARISRKTSSTLTEVSVVDTSGFVARLSTIHASWKDDIAALNEVVEWQHRVIDFNSSYVAYLLDQIDEEEFEKVAESSAVEEEDKDVYEIAGTIDRLLRLTRLEYTASDFSNMFGCSQDNIIEALESLGSKYPKVQVMLSGIRE
ncbi:hypothetical protein [Pseudomonas sp. PAB10]|uniref:hypothetical protein n=1 Tax=Pseudomonas sp. PAB10 TaxID=3233047 RepID=UPI003F9DC728